MGIVVLGKGQLAIEVCRYIHNNGHKLSVVPVEPEPSWAPSLSDFCISAGIPIIKWEEFRIEDRKFSLGISVFFDKIFKSPDIDKFDILLNIHNAPLPKYRGVNPINWALKNGEFSHGVTIHQITESIDTGDIYGQRIFPINPHEDEVEDVYKRCLATGYELFVDVFENLPSITPLPQDSSKATYFSKLDFSKLGEREGFRRPSSV